MPTGRRLRGESHQLLLGLRVIAVLRFIYLVYLRRWPGCGRTRAFVDAPIKSEPAARHQSAEQSITFVYGGRPLYITA